MANDSFHDPAVVGPIAGLIGAILVWLAQRLIGKAAIQEAATTYLHEVLDQLRTELRVAIRERDKAREGNIDRDAKIEELQKTIAAFQRQIAAMSLSAEADG